MKKIGYWYSTFEPQYPMPIENSASDEQVSYQLEILERFSKNAREVFFKGFSTCRLCRKINGSTEFFNTINGEGYGIPNGLKHYIEDHKVLVPEIFDIYK